jgi:hypothetical protein
VTKGHLKEVDKVIGSDNKRKPPPYEISIIFFCFPYKKY